MEARAIYRFNDFERRTYICAYVYIHVRYWKRRIRPTAGRRTASDPTDAVALTPDSPTVREPTRSAP